MSAALGRLLAIDTAAPVVGAALGSAGLVEGRWSARCVRGADAALLPAVQALLQQAAGPLDGIVVTVGPGAFTGLRVGVATALGLAVARRVPVYPVSALACRAALAAGADRPVLALLDARKGRVYAGRYAVEAGAPRALGPEVDADLEEVLPDEPFIAVGEGAMVYAEVLQARGGRLHVEADACPVEAMLGLARAEDALDAGEVALRYLRGADAVRPRDLGVRVGAAG